jgi:hypothetical protein
MVAAMSHAVLVAAAPDDSAAAPPSQGHPGAPGDRSPARQRLADAIEARDTAGAELSRARSALDRGVRASWAAAERFEIATKALAQARDRAGESAAAALLAGMAPGHDQTLRKARSWRPPVATEGTQSERHLKWATTAAFGPSRQFAAMQRLSADKGAADQAIDSGKRRRRAHSLAHIENDMNDALDVVKPLWSEREGNFDPAIRRSVNVEDEPRRSEFDQAHTEVSGIPVGLVRFDITDASIVILELALNEEIGLHWR